MTPLLLMIALLHFLFFSSPHRKHAINLPSQKASYQVAPTLASLMFRRTPLTPKRADGGNIRFETLLLGAIRPGGQLDQRMQRDLHPGTLLLRDIHIIRVDAPEDSLMRHDDDILTAFQLHDDGLESDDHIAIGFPAAVAVIVFVVVSGFEVFGVLVGDLLVGEAVACARVEFVEGFPFELVVAFGGGGEEAGRLVGAFEGGGPDRELAVVTDGGSDEVGERAGVEFPAFGDVGVAADFAGEVEFGFAMLDGG